MAYVWIDPAGCMGAGTCGQIVPEVFVERTDGVWAVKEDGSFFGSDTIFDGRSAPEGHLGRARVPSPLLDLVIEAAEECPGECIFVEA
jgi:ferredoxin